MNPFDYYYEQVKSKGDLNLDPTWGQGKTTYGGMSAALGLAAIERDLTAQKVDYRRYAQSVFTFAVR